MSRTIDERIVEMRFDNKQFESGVKESLSTLDRLKAALKLDEAVKGFDKIDKAANNISLAGISAGIEELQKRFSTLGIVGMRVIENITDSLMHMATAAMRYASDAIVSGGLQRAQNIENAHFQLQALLKDEIAVQAVMSDAMASVDGTAYAYDEAAKAASQFAASGMRAGEDMQSALRGITGVAAMTNSQYEDISRIFTTVAGNGRLMGDQLLQLSSRGLNAAATVADYFREVQGLTEITEADIRELVSKGEISFQTFAAAMDWAFGESAFRANETFTGALSNMRSALARIGAGFFSPLIEQNSDLVLTINAIRERINDVKGALVFDEQKSAISGLTKVTGLQKEALDEMFSAINENGAVSSEHLRKLSENGVDATKTLTNYINGVTDGSIRATYATKSALEDLTGGLTISESQVEQFVEDGKINLATFTSAMEIAFGDQKLLSKQFTDSVLDMAKGVSEFLKGLDVTKPIEIFYSNVESIKNLFKGLYSLISPIGRAFSEVFLSFNIDDIGVLADKIQLLTSKMKLSEEASKNLHDAFKGVFDIVKLLVDGFVSFLNAVLPVKEPITSLGSLMLDLAGSIGRTLSEFTEWVRKSASISNAYELIGQGVEIASSWIKVFIETVKGFPIVETMVGLITNAFNAMSNAFDKIGERFTPVNSLFKNLTQIIVSAVPSASSIIHALGEALEFCLTIFSKISESADFNAVLDGLNTFVSLGLIAGINKFVQDISWFVKSGNGIFSNFERISKTLTSMLDDLQNTLRNFQNELKSNVLRNLAISIGILAASLLILSTIDSDKLTASLGVVTILMGEMLASLSGFEKIVAGAKLKLTSIATGLILFSTSIAILAGAFKKLSNVDSDKIRDSLASISVLVAELTGVALVLGKYGGKIDTGAVKLIAFSAAIYILSSAVEKLGSLNTDTLINGLSSVSVLIAELSAFMVASKFGGFKTGQAVAIIGLSAALLILQKAVEGFGNLDTEKLLNGILAVAGVLSEISAFTLASGYSKHILSTSESLVIIAYALNMLTGPMKEFGEMSLEEIGRGLLAIGGALAEITAALRLMPNNTLIISSGLLVMAEALEVISRDVSNMGNMSWEEIAKGLIALAGSLAILSVSMNVMKGTLGASAAMLVMSAALAVFTPTLKSLGGMSWEEIAKGLIALAGSFTIIGVAGMLLGPIVPVIIGLAGAMTLLGAAITLVGVGITAVSVGLMTLATSGVAYAASATIRSVFNSLTGLFNVEVVRLMITGVLDAIAASAKSIGNTLKTLILVVCEVLLECIPEIVEVALTLIKEVLTSLASNAPTIVHALLEFIIGIIDALAEDMPQLVQSVVNLFMTFFSSVIDALKGMDTEVLIDAIAGVGFISALMLAFAGMSAIAPAAMAGVLEIGIVIAELALVLAAIGALSKIPGLNWLIGEGGNLLQTIGTAIGQFIGGIVGGVMSGVSAQFPKIATDLSNFMENIQPFLEGAANIDSSIVSGVLSLVEAILLITAADLINGIASFLLGGSDFDKFGEQIVNFGKGISKFSEEVKNINPNTVTAASNCALALAALYTNMPKEDGWMQKITGQQKSLAEFAEELIPFGEALVQYSNKVSGKIDQGAVEASIKAAEVLAAFADKLPDMGGLKGLIFGNQKTLAEFGSELIPFGQAMVSYSTIVNGKIDQGAVEASISAAEVLLAFNEKLPDMGGLKQLIFGHQKTLSEFAEELKPFGQAMVSYSTIVAGKIQPEAVKASAAAAEMLVALQNGLGNTGGLKAFFVGDNSLDDFGKQLKKFGEGLAAYGESIVNVDTVKMKNVTAEAQILANLANDIRELDTSGMTRFSEALKEMADNGIDAFIEAFDGAVSRVQTAVDSLITSAENQVITSGKSLEITARDEGTAIITNINSGIETSKPNVLSVVQTLGSSIITKLTNSLPEANFKSLGLLSILGLATGIINGKSTVTTNTSTVANAVVTQMRTSLPDSTFKTIGQNTMSAIANGISDGKSTVKTAASTVANSVTGAVRDSLSYNEFYSIGANVAEGLGAGIRTKISDIVNAATSAANAAIDSTRRTLEVRSPSRVFMEIGRYVSLGLANGILNYISTVTDAGDTLADMAINPVKTAVDYIQQLLEEGVDEYNPVITPVIDLSSTEEAIGDISSMFGRMDLTRTARLAEIASSGFSQNYIRVIREEEDDRELNAKLNRFLEDRDEEPIVKNENTFYITSADPKQAAEEVGYIMQHKVERGRAVWGYNL